MFEFLRRDRGFQVSLAVVAILFASGFAASLSSCGASSTLHAAGTQEGLASYYSNDFQGRRTSSGDIFDNSQLTAAHRTFPFGTIVRVTNLRNGSSVEVRINDRGPVKPERVIDLTLEAARQIGMEREGLAHVRLEVLR